MVVFLGRNLIHVFLGIEADFSSLGSTQVFNHLFLINVLLKSQIYYCILSCIQQVITFVLRVMKTELAVCKFVGRMYLQAQVSPTHGIKEIKTYREILAETGPYLLA